MSFASCRLTQADRDRRRADEVDHLHQQVRAAILALEAAYHVAEPLAIPAVESALLSAIARAHHAEFVLRAAQE